MTPHLREKTTQLPVSPGVYIMRGAGGNVLYVGKARNLRARVRQYVAGHDTRPQIRFLMRDMHDIDCVVTSSEKEALFLENTLIKSHRPPYNVVFRDDKDYLWLKLDRRHPFPRLLFVRRPKPDGSKVFGPYASARAVRDTVKYVTGLFPLRTCSDHEFSNRSRPCLEYQMQRCPAPCVNYISAEEYAHRVNELTLFLEGKKSDLIRALVAEMARASEEERFEEAAKFRDRIVAVRKTLEPQSVVRHDDRDRDVLGYARDREAATLLLMNIRQGKLTHTHTYPKTDVLEDDDELILSFILQHYEDAPIPAEILLPQEIKERDAIEDWLRGKARRAVCVTVPRRGASAALVSLARKNAQIAFDLARQESDRIMNALSTLEKELHLNGRPDVMECTDISNLGGDHSVASVVRFRLGRPSKKEYRRYKIRFEGGADDYARIREVVRRRYGRLSREKHPMPDLIVIDGGRGHVESADEVLRELGLDRTDLIGLAKDRDAPKGARIDKIYKPGMNKPFVFEGHTDAIHLLMRLRDEAHRFAVTFHRHLRSKGAVRSEIRSVPGLGPKRTRRLLEAFGSVKNIREAGVDELVKRAGLPANTATKVHRHFHPDSQGA